MSEDSPPPDSPQPPTIAVDAMGGDHAPAEIVAGAIAAAAGHDMTVVLTGRPSQLRPLLGKHQEGGDIIVLASASVIRDRVSALLLASVNSLNSPGNTARTSRPTNRTPQLAKPSCRWMTSSDRLSPHIQEGPSIQSGIIAV